jgi:hypothetical protein
MSGKTELRQATLISEQKVVPGTGTLTGITVSAPITGGGAGPVVPIGATQYDATHVGFVPSPGVNNHTLILWDNGWFVPPASLPVDAVGFLHNNGGGLLTWEDIGIPTLPISIAHGGTGLDGTDLLDWTVTSGDSATTVMSLSATDSNANTSTVSWGIELPGDGASAGDAVLRTDIERVRVVAGSSETAFKAPFANISITATEPTHGTPAVYLVGTDSAGAFTQGSFGLLDFDGNVFGISPDGTGGSGGPLFLDFTGGVRRVYVTDNSTFVAPTEDPTAIFHTHATSGRTALWGEATDGIGGLFTSLSGPSIVAQTPDVAGGNPNATMIVKANTGQTANNFESYDTDGATLRASITPGGNLDAASFSSAGGVPYVLPATNGAGVLTNDGAGNLSWV